MKKAGLNIEIVIIIVIALISTGLLFQVKKMFSLKRKVREKQEELAGVKSAGNILNELKKEVDKGREEEESLFRMVPRRRGAILNAMKELTLLGKRLDLKYVTFDLQQEEGKEGGKAGEETSDSSVSWKGFIPIDLPVSKGNIDSRTIVPYQFKMLFESEYAQLVSFIEKALELEQIVNINQVLIKRSPDVSVLPRQEVILIFTTYTYSYPIEVHEPGAK